MGAAPGARIIEDAPRSFLGGLAGLTIVLDEVHPLANPSEVLELAADHYHATKIIATGSSTLGASSKFKDTLAGRKRELWLTPMTTADLLDFGRPDLKHRFLHGGLPPFFLADTLPKRDFQEWMDAYWAKDIQELFRLERRSSFLKFAELLMLQSGGIFEATRFTRPCEVSRPTITKLSGCARRYIPGARDTPVQHPSIDGDRFSPQSLRIRHRFHVVPRGWEALRNEDLGSLCEHFVLNEIQAHMQDRGLHYWRDKRGHEVDFVLTRRGKAPVAIEWRPTSTRATSRPSEDDTLTAPT